MLPRQLPELETAWLGYPLIIREGAGFERPDLQAFLDGRGIDTRTIWTGNVARQPMVRGHRLVLPDDGLPNADVVMERGVLLPAQPRHRRRHPRLRARHPRGVPRRAVRRDGLRRPV